MKPDFWVPLRRDWIKLMVPEAPGCYAAFNRLSACDYVGRATNLLNRVLSHYVDQNDGLGTRWRLAGNSEWYVRKPSAGDSGFVLWIWQSPEHIKLERHLVRTLQPNFNTFRYDSTTNQFPSRLLLSFLFGEFMCGEPEG